MITGIFPKGLSFINSGFNLRPLEVSAAIGLSQFKRLNSMINIRINNRKKIINKLINSSLWNNQFSFLDIYIERNNQNFSD